MPLPEGVSGNWVKDEAWPVVRDDVLYLLKCFDCWWQEKIWPIIKLISLIAIGSFLEQMLVQDPMVNQLTEDHLGKWPLMRRSTVILLHRVNK